MIKVYGFSEQYVLYELPMVRGWAYHAESIEKDPWMGFVGIKRSSPGYVSQEIKSMMEMVK